MYFSEEKKVKKYLEDNYQHRTDLISPIPELKTNGDVPAESKKYQGTGQKTKEGKGLFLSLNTVFRGQNMEFGNIRVDVKYVVQKLK